MLVILFVVGWPLALLAFMLLMDRVEAPFRVSGTAKEQIDSFLAGANRDEVETLAQEGYARAWDRYRRRRRAA